MPGLNLGLGGGVKIGAAGSAGTRKLSGQGATVAQTAYGAGSSPNTAGSGQVEPWHLATAVPIAAVAWLAFLRWSLPG